MASATLSSACGAVTAAGRKHIVAIAARPQHSGPQPVANARLGSSSKAQRVSRASAVRVAAMAASTATQKSVSGTMAALKAEGK